MQNSHHTISSGPQNLAKVKATHVSDPSCSQLMSFALGHLDKLSLLWVFLVRLAWRLTQSCHGDCQQILLWRTFGSSALSYHVRDYVSEGIFKICIPKHALIILYSNIANSPVKTCWTGTNDVVPRVKWVPRMFQNFSRDQPAYSTATLFYPTNFPAIFWQRLRQSRFLLKQTFLNRYSNVLYHNQSCNHSLFWGI